MKKQTILILLTIFIITTNINADILAELAKRDGKNPIHLTDSSVLYSKDGYLYTEYWADGGDMPAIVAYKIRGNSVNLIIRIKTWDFAYREDNDFNKVKDEFIVTVHNYYLVELSYINDNLVINSKRVKDINAEGFIFNEAKINGNVKEVTGYYITTPYLKEHLKEGDKIKVAEFTNIRANQLMVNSHWFNTYDYYYQILVDGKKVRINGYLLDFDNKINYRVPL